MLVRNVAIVADGLTSKDAATVASEITQLAAALQIQVSRDFSPIWEVDATVSAFTALNDVPLGHWPVIVKEDIGDPGAGGFHLDKSNQPYALVAYDDSWTLTVSHETLEMLADPFGNRTVPGPSLDEAHATDRVSYLVEVCDPCEDSSFSYSINGIVVSDFITPHFHDPAFTSGARYSFTGAITEPRQVLKNGYISWEDPTLGFWYQLTNFGGKVIKKLEAITGKSLREEVNKQSPRPNASYDPKGDRVTTAADHYAGARDASAARASALQAMWR